MYIFMLNDAFIIRVFFINNKDPGFKLTHFAVGLCNMIRIFIHINSSPPSAAFMRPWTGSALVQVMACRLFGAKPFPGPVLAYCQSDSREQFSVKFESEFYHFHSRKCILKCRLPKWRPFCPGGDKLILFLFLVLKLMWQLIHNNDVIMSAMASQITGISIVYSTVSSGANHSKHQSFATGLCEGNSPVTG